MLRTPLLAFALGLGIAPTTSLSARICPADDKLASLVAASDLVVVGKMDVPRQRLADEAGKQSPEWLDIPIQVESVVKGGSLSGATVRFYPHDAGYKPSNDAVLRLAGKSAILFLTRVDDGPVGVYFAGYTPDALKPATDLTVTAARAEASRQAQIVASWHADTTRAGYAEVRALITRLGRVSGNEQQQVFDRLVELGEAVVPAIIAQMDDRRALRTREIALVNHAPDAFERTRHYGPEQVVDGLDAVLNQITGQFGSIVNGGSDRQRTATVAGWRVFAADLACKEGK